jgi:hypothetical protein
VSLPSAALTCGCWLQEAAAAGAQLLCLPEAFSFIGAAQTEVSRGNRRVSAAVASQESRYWPKYLTLPHAAAAHRRDDICVDAHSSLVRSLQ